MSHAAHIHHDQTGCGKIQTSHENTVIDPQFEFRVPGLRHSDAKPPRPAYAVAFCLRLAGVFGAGFRPSPSCFASSDRCAEYFGAVIG